MKLPSLGFRNGGRSGGQRLWVQTQDVCSCILYSQVEVRARVFTIKEGITHPVKALSLFRRQRFPHAACPPNNSLSAGSRRESTPLEAGPGQPAGGNCVDPEVNE